MLDLLAAHPHYRAHVGPVWRALPDAVRGTVIDRTARKQPQPNAVLLVSGADIRRARDLGYSRIALLEHGIGQSYHGGRSPSYPGAPGRQLVGLFLSPNATASAHDRAAYPNARHAVVGDPVVDTIPRREYISSDFTGLESEAWTSLLAAIQQRPRTFASTVSGNVCVAHAIADASQTEPGDSNSPAIPRRPSTTDSDTYDVDLRLPLDQPDLVARLTEAVKLAISECTLSCVGFSRTDATSAAQRTGGLRPRSVGILLNRTGSSSRDSGVLTLRIQTTTFGSVSFAIPTTTAWPSISGPEALRPVVCISFHWSWDGIPEMRSAFAHYRAILPELAAAFPGRLIGHAHPRAAGSLERFYRKAGIEFVADFADVCRRADVYVNDQVSTLYEFASTGRPVVVLNAPWYRREVQQGLRFWSAAHVGIQVDEPADLVQAVQVALSDPPAQQVAREAALDIVYQPRTGAAALAATALVGWLDERQEAAA